MKPSITLESLGYSLSACKHLEQLFMETGDKESVRHFQRRQREIERQIRKVGK